jgi:hypothetical protein
MKKIILATFLFGMMGGCAENKIEKKCDVDSSGLPWNVIVFILEKHQYVAYSNAGLVHSESCKCKEVKK